jgi:hypothetical protein
VASGTAPAKRLAKGFAGAATSPVWLLQKGIIPNNDGTLTYFEEVANKPNDEVINNPNDKDTTKLATGRGEVIFKYNGTYTDLSSFDPNLISDIVSWHFIGREAKTFKPEIDSIIGTVQFSQGSFLDTNSIKPGDTTSFWVKNISATLDMGRDDTAAFILDSLDDIKHEQYGEGFFLDAHTGKDNSEPAKSFKFDFTLIHKNTHGPNPYLHYEDNEGIMSFAYPWGNTGKSLYFTIHFYPNFDRTGEIRENSKDGTLRVSFIHNDKTDIGSVTYYNEKGERL